MKTILNFLSILTFGLCGTAPAEIVFGGGDTTDVDNWTTNSVAFDQGTADGFSLNWENVVANTAAADSGGNKFDLYWEAGTNYMIGHIFLYDGMVDLSTLPAGIERLKWTADFQATGFANWSPVIAVTDAGVTTFYRWNHSGNTWNGNGALDFSLGIYDLSQNGNGTGGGAGVTGIWGELVATAGDFGSTRINGSNPNLQAATGVVQFGFLQWGGSTGGSITPGSAFSTAIDSFEVVVNEDVAVPEPPTVVALPGASDSAAAITMAGEVTDNGNENPSVTVFYGAIDGGTDAGSWDFFVDLGFQGGGFSTTITGLMPGGTYVYRCFAANSAGSDWSDTATTVVANVFQGVPTALDSGSFDYRYEMDVNPSGQDLDGAGSANDWFANPAMAVGVDQTMWIPQTYANGIGLSSQSAAPPEALFRTDFVGSIQRQSISGDFTIEISVRLLEGTLANPFDDLGGFGLFLNPAGQSALRLNIGETGLSIGSGLDPVATPSNTDGLHVFRIAFVENDRRFWVWRDGQLVYGGSVDPEGGVVASAASLFPAGGFLLGDFAANLSGDWEIDYIRLHDAAVAPVSSAAGELLVTGFGFLDLDTVFIDFKGAANAAHQVTSSVDLTDFSTIEPLTNETTGFTDGSGNGHVEIDVTGRTAEDLFFRIEGL